jgi:hypothetical protein
MRSQLNALKTLIDAQQATIDSQQSQIGCDEFVHRGIAGRRQRLAGQSVRRKNYSP